MTVLAHPRVGATAAIGLGLLAVVGATALGSGPGRLDALVTPPPLVRAVLVAASAAVAVVLLGRFLERVSSTRADDVRGLIRGVRYAFLALAALAAGAGWLVGHPLPLVVAAVIAGIDVIETSVLLLVVGGRDRDVEIR